MRREHLQRSSSLFACIVVSLDELYTGCSDDIRAAGQFDKILSIMTLQPTPSRVLTHPARSRYFAELRSAFRSPVQGGRA